MNNTINYYNQNAENFIANTQNADMHPTQDIQLKVLHFLKQNPSSIPFIRMGQIALFIKKCNIPGIVFDHIWGKYANDANTVDTSDTNTLSDKKRKTHYWMYTVFDDNSWLECQEKGVMVLGMEFRKHPIRQ
jgi:hypothetical protein